MPMNIQYYGFFKRGRKYVEVLATKEQDKSSTDVETGITYPTFVAAEQAVLDKNIAITRERFGA